MGIQCNRALGFGAGVRVECMMRVQDVMKLSEVKRSVMTR